MGRNILIILALAIATAPTAAETVKYFDYSTEKEITEEEAGRKKHRVKTFDDAGNETSKRYFNAAGEPTTQNGVHLVEYTYDSRGNKEAEARWGVAGEPAAWHSVHKME
jgi:hypothetical protein